MADTVDMLALPSAATAPDVVPASEPPAARPRRAVPWRRARELCVTLATGIAAAGPVLVSAVRAVRDGWVPGADQAIIATRAYDVFTGHTPLVGQYSLASGVSRVATHNLGPMLFWLVALPSRFGGPEAMVLTMGAVNTLAIIATVAVARRRGGWVLMFATALAIVLMCQSLAAETFHDVLNPSAALFPFLLLIFLCWSVACGDYRLLPVSVLVASFVVQAHFTYVLPTAGLLAVAVGGLVLGRLVGRRRDVLATEVVRARRWSLARWSLAALVTGCVCWSAPIVDQLTVTPGNFTQVLRTASAPNAKLGRSVGWHAVVRAVGVTPWWLYVPASRWERKYDVRATPGALRRDTALALLAALVLAAVVGLVRRRGDVLAAALTGLVLCAALGEVAASTPAAPEPAATLGYTMWWGSQLGMWVWLIVAWSAWLGAAWVTRTVVARVAVRGLRRPWSRPAWARPAWVGALVAVAVSVLGIGAVAVAAGAVAATETPDEHVALYRPIAALVGALDRRIPRGSTVLLKGWLAISPLPIKPALRYFLVRHGVRVLAPGSNLRLGDWYELHDRPYDASLFVVDKPTAPVAHVSLLARVSYTDGWGAHVVTVWIGPGSRRRTATARVARARAIRR